MEKVLKHYAIIIIEVVILLILAIILINHFEFKRVEKECFRAYKYSQGMIYIGDKECLQKIEKADNKILVLDAREENNPDMKVYDSYKISDTGIQEEILDKLLYHEELYPSKWDRTKKSMMNEWYAHNLLYNMNIKRDRTTDVDFDNNEEEVYKEKIGVNTIIKYFSK